ncbi:MAG: HTTM domain-containing protein [Sandaracinus sp.]|nr:HTTM domain-containing protein [Sandaracinus sp.]
MSTSPSEADAKNADAKNADAKNADAKNADAKNADAKNADAKNADAKNADAKNAEQRGAFDRFWRPTTPALRLATLRVLVGTYGFVYVLVRLPHLLSYALDDVQRFQPVGLATLAPSPTLPIVYKLLVGLVVLSSASFLLGFRHRWLAPLHAMLLTWVLTYTNSWGKILHTDNLFLAHVVVLAFAPAADTLSLDARAAKRRGAPAPADHARYGWPPKLMVALAAATYLLAGIAKLRNGGLHFFGGETLRNFVAFDNARKIELGDIHSPIGAALLPYPGLFAVLAWFSMLLEFGAPLALNRRIGRYWALGMWGFHLGVLALMAIGFVYPLSFLAFAACFDVEKLWSRRPLRALGRKLGS